MDVDIAKNLHQRGINFPIIIKGPLTLKKMERKEAGENTLKKYNVQGFPTVIMIDENGNGKPFEGDRTISGLEKFANQE